MDNRFITMSKQLSSLKSCNSNTLESRFSLQKTTLDYTVPGAFNAIQQPTNMVCWATVATMMRCWKMQRSQTIATTMQGVGAMYLTKFQNNQGLAANEKPQFLQSMGLAFEYPQSLSIVGWEQMLRTYGPVWITTAEGTDSMYGIHARVLIGIRGDGTPAGTTLTIADPATGTVVREHFNEFLTKFEREVRTSTQWDGRIQIVHFAERLVTQHSWSNMASINMNIDQAGIELIKRFEGFRAQKYNDQAGHCTIGYGTIIHHGNCNGDTTEQPYNNGVTEARATELLMQRVSAFVAVVNSNVNTALNQNQFNALVSFVYNLGESNFRNSTLLRQLNAGNLAQVPVEIRRWNKVRINGVLQESEGLTRRRNEEANLFAGTSSGQSIAQSINDGYSKPFYDTGEHAILGSFINAASTGALAGVQPAQPTTHYRFSGVDFTYGQIMSCGDFYEDYTQMSRATEAELRGLQRLILQSENHYKNTILHIGAASRNPGNADWTGAVGSRYLDLALRNNSHFAPNSGNTGRSNRDTWRQYHAAAIAIARQSPPNLDEAYKTNAFGDHFLTDAFSAGHLVNKQLVIDRFIGNMISGTSITSAGDTLLQSVARGALAIPRVNQELGRWELVETRAGIHLDLNTTAGGIAPVFYNVLKEILLDTAHGGRTQIANLAAKAVHDFLNTYNGRAGVPVRNTRGESWSLSGDETLNTDNINRIQQAVKQSIQNIATAASNHSLSVASLQDAVLAYIPNLNDPTTSQIVNDAVAVFTNPSSQQLVAAAIHLVDEELSTLLNALHTAGKIRRISGRNLL